MVLSTDVTTMTTINAPVPGMQNRKITVLSIGMLIICLERQCEKILLPVKNLE